MYVRVNLGWMTWQLRHVMYVRRAPRELIFKARSVGQRRTSQDSRRPPRRAPSASAHRTLCQQAAACALGSRSSR